MNTKVDARRISQDSQADLRRRGIAQLRSGVSQRKVADNLNVHRQTVLKWSKWMKSAMAEVTFTNRKRGPKAASAEKRLALDKKQQECLRKIIVGKVPGQMKFDFALWTTRAVQELALRLFQVRVSRNTLCRYLRSWGMTPQRPKKTALQKDPEAVEVWLHETYPAISRRANAENAIIFWQDETGIQQDTNAVKGYSPCGQTPVIMQDRRSCYGAPVMLSAVNNQGLVHFKFQKSAVTAQDFIGFLEDLLKDNEKYGRKLFVICDNARIHHARIVKEWLLENKDRIELFFLPAYSPDLNPDEYLNRQIKTQLREKPAMNHAGCQKVAEAFMTAMKAAEHWVRKLFDSEAVQYARAYAFHDLLLPAPAICHTK